MFKILSTYIAIVAIVATITIYFMRHVTAALWQILAAAEPTNSARREKLYCSIAVGGIYDIS